MELRAAGAKAGAKGRRRTGAQSPVEGLWVCKGRSASGRLTLGGRAWGVGAARLAEG